MLLKKFSLQVKNGFLYEDDIRFVTKQIKDRITHVLRERDRRANDAGSQQSLFSSSSSAGDSVVLVSLHSTAPVLLQNSYFSSTLVCLIIDMDHSKISFSLGTCFLNLYFSFPKLTSTLVPLILKTVIMKQSSDLGNSYYFYRVLYEIKNKYVNIKQNPSCLICDGKI